MWRLQHKLYEEGTRWYCSICCCRTVVELNPLYVSDGKPVTYDDKKYEYLVRCSRCKHSNYYISSFDCPHCGRPQEYDQSPLCMTKPQSSAYASYEFGVDGYEWEEKYRCKTCGRIYWIQNANF